MNPVTRIRRFNRVVTQHIGALDARYLGRPRPLGASRVLYEIGLQGAEVRHLRARLGLDSGYASRLLRQLEREGLVRTAAGPRDQRARIVRLTAKGRKELDVLNRLSDDLATSLLQRLTPGQQEELVGAMATVERLLLAGSIQVEAVDPRSPPAQYCLARYFAELEERFESGFDPDQSISTSMDDFVPPNGVFVVASLNQEPVGSGAIRWHPDYAYIKRMWVDPATRGMGVGSRILTRLEELAGDHGMTLVRLETNQALTEAQALYRKRGYREVQPFNDERYAHHWFEKALTHREG